VFGQMGLAVHRIL